MVKAKDVQGKVGRYEVSVYGSASGRKLNPSSSVHNSEYGPSREVEKQLADMWKHRRPTVVGAVSEAIALEVLNGARIDVDGSTWTLLCEKLRNVQEISGVWQPATGIYCDDLIATAERDGKRLLLLTEVKGTTRTGGLSRSMEAKMFYQLARTCVTLSQLMPSGPPYRIVGAITVVILHSQRKIIMNVLNEKAARGYFPDGWLDPEKERY